MVNINGVTPAERFHYSSKFSVFVFSFSSNIYKRSCYYEKVYPITAHFHQYLWSIMNSQQLLLTALILSLSAVTDQGRSWGGGAASFRGEASEFSHKDISYLSVVSSY